MDYEKKIESLKTKILEHENDLLKLRAKKAALERERDMAMQQKIMGGNGYDSKREI